MSAMNARYLASSTSAGLAAGAGLANGGTGRCDGARCGAAAGARPKPGAMGGAAFRAGSNPAPGCRCCCASRLTRTDAGTCRFHHCVLGSFSEFCNGGSRASSSPAPRWRCCCASCWTSTDTETGEGFCWGFHSKGRVPLDA